MITIPRWLPNTLFFLAFVVTLFQIGRLAYSKRPAYLQYCMAPFLIVMLATSTFLSVNRFWAPLGLLVVAIICLAIMVRQIRYMPQREKK